MCGEGNKKRGDKIIAFICEDSKNFGEYHLNKYVPFSGWVKNDRSTYNKVMNYLGIN